MRRAAETMASALDVTGDYCRSQEIRVDPLQDPAGTCLVGPQLTPLFTTLGQLEAKRTTLSPDLAGLLVHLLEEAGVGSGDTVAVGASGSFPGLLVATLAAAEALRAVPVAILSLGASSYGATRPEFHLLDLHLLLNREGILRTPPAAASLGGEGDVGKGFPPALRHALAQEVRRVGIPFLEEDSLPANVTRRMEIYCGIAGRVDPGPKGPSAPAPSGISAERACAAAAFVSIGGALANMGTSPGILQVPPGLSRDLANDLDLPPPPQRGVLFQMASHGVPVIHLLHIRGLALKHGLSWDPLTLPEPATTKLRSGSSDPGLLFWLLTILYLLGVGLLLGPVFLSGARCGNGLHPVV